jgi:hypothetical protein
MRRMALRSLAIAACLIAPLFTAEAAQKMRPPLPKPKPAEIATPAPSQSTAPEANETETTPPESEASDEQASASHSAIGIPREKPAELKKPEAEAPAAPDLSEPEIASPEPEKDQSTRVKSAIVIPREKPFELRKPAPKPHTGEDQSQEKPDAGEEFATCRQELAALGARFNIPVMQAAAADVRCTVRNPVQISAIESATGEIDFPGEPILNCVFAKKFTAWASDVAGPVVKAETGEALAAIMTGSSYECRGRNGDSSGKISEHAFGNAIDITSFKLRSKESMPVANVAKTQNVESRWLMALRISACGYFTTVLGPGSNAAHAEHYHFDLGLHGKSSNYRICQ